MHIEKDGEDLNRQTVTVRMDDPLGIVQENNVWPCGLFVYAQTRIYKKKWGA